MNTEKLQNTTPESNEALKTRHTARAVLFDESGQVAIINVKKHGYYKIPGGGIEDGENIEAAIQREIMKESGCNSTIINELGQRETSIPGWGIHDISSGFIAVATGEKSAPNYEDYETARGFDIEWFPSLNKAIDTIENNSVENPDARLLQERDLAFLKLAREKLAQGEI